MKRTLRAVLGIVLILTFVVASCFSARDQSAGSLSGRMLLWHPWTDSQAEALATVLAAFEELYPAVTVRQQAFASVEEMQEQYLNSVSSGLGPDLLLAPSSWLRDLGDTQSLAAVTSTVDEAVLERTMPAALATMRLDDDLYGLPLALDVAALYYNRALVDTPPPTLDDLLAQAAEGQVVLIPTNFYDAVWGVQAFGGQLFDDTGRTILDRGGFANWLAWLKDAREVPGIILDGNRAVLRSRFTAGQAGYYIGYARELAEIRTALGPDAVGVAPLPSGPVGAPGPFLSVDGFIFSPVSSDNQRTLALALAQFITNSEQSGYLMRTAQIVPANSRVRVNPRLNPIVASFAAQARSAMPVPDRPDIETLFALGTDGINRALEGDLPAAEVAFETANAINEATGFAVMAAPETACTTLGTIRLAHTWEGRAADALASLVQRYDEICPLVIINSEPLNPDTIAPRLAGARLPGLRPTMALGPQAWLNTLVEQTLLLNITPLMDAATLQKFWPSALEAMRVQGSLYGLPVTLHVDALYYNRTLVERPAALLDELRSQASQGIPVTLDVTFPRAFWGIGAFGGRLFDAEYRVLLDQGGMAGWLAWLRESRDLFGLTLTTDGETLRAQFMAGETAYYVAGPEELAALQEALGADNLGVALLPSGPSGSSTPLIRAQGFFFRASAGEQAGQIARDFARFATDTDSQRQLVEEAGLLPANATVGLGRHPELAVFGEQLRTGVLPPNHPAYTTVLRMGDQAYRAALDEGLDPAEAVAAMTRRINEANDVLPLPTPEPTPEPDMVTEPVTASTPISVSAPITASGALSTPQPAAAPTAP